MDTPNPLVKAFEIAGETGIMLTTNWNKLSVA